MLSLKNNTAKNIDYYSISDSEKFEKEKGKWNKSVLHQLTYTLFETRASVSFQSFF